MYKIIAKFKTYSILTSIFKFKLKLKAPLLNLKFTLSSPIFTFKIYIAKPHN